MKDDDKYTCPICDHRVKIPRDAARPKLEDLQDWRDELQSLPFQPEEEHVLDELISTAADFRRFVDGYCQPYSASPNDINTQRFYLRKIEGADILLAHETNFFRQEVHRLAPVAPDAPAILHESNSTRKPRPTKTQKLMAQYGVNTPEDLPQELRTKQHTFKHHRKSTDSIGRVPPPLQPAPAPSKGPEGTNGVPGSGAQSTNAYRPLSRVLTSVPDPAYGTDPAYANMFSTSPQTESAGDLINLSPPLPWQNRPSTANQSNPPETPKSPLFRPDTPLGSNAPLDPSIFSPSNSSFAAAALRDSANAQAMVSPRFSHSRGNSGGGDMDNLFANFTNENDNADELNRNEAGEALEGLGVVGGSSQDDDQAQRLADEFLTTSTS